jgi:predicted nucleic acid-binding protein
VRIVTVILVLDASAAAAVVFREPDGLLVAPHLFPAARVLVPQLFHLELANVARTKVVRREIDARRASQLLADVHKWPLDVISVRWERALRLALRSGLTVYDASYLRLARDRRVGLLTLDRALRVAGGRLTLPRGPLGRVQ